MFYGLTRIILPHNTGGFLWSEIWKVLSAALQLLIWSMTAKHRAVHSVNRPEHTHTYGYRPWRRGLPQRGSSFSHSHSAATLHDERSYEADTLHTPCSPVQICRSPPCTLETKEQTQRDAWAPCWSSTSPSPRSTCSKQIWEMKSLVFNALTLINKPDVNLMLVPPDSIDRKTTILRNASSFKRRDMNNANCPLR